MRIDDLPIPALDQLSHEQQLKLILSVRERRRCQPERKQARARLAPKNMSKLLTNASVDQLQELLSILQKQ